MINCYVFFRLLHGTLRVLTTVSARVVWCIIIIVAFCISYASLLLIDKFNNRALLLFTHAAIPIPALSQSSYIKPQQLPQATRHLQRTDRHANKRAALLPTALYKS
jgi:hypothetical protein